MSIQLYQNRIPVVWQDLGLYQGLLPIDLPALDTTPVLQWKGSRLDPFLWAQIVSFFRWTYAEHQTEAQVRLFYNEELAAWRTEVFPQEITGGLAVTELREHPLKQQVWDSLDILQWKEAGTVHHHCGASAFQSGTDHADEITKNGLHITVGHMDSDVLDLHARATYRGVMYDVAVSDWLEGDPDFWVSPCNVDFPESWKAMMIPKPKPVLVKVDRDPEAWRKWREELSLELAADNGVWPNDDLESSDEWPEASAGKPEASPVDGYNDEYEELEEAQATVRQLQKLVEGTLYLSSFSRDMDAVLQFLEAYVNLKYAIPGPCDARMAILELINAEARAGIIIDRDWVDTMGFALDTIYYMDRQPKAISD